MAAKPRWRPMKSAPKNREIILKFNNLMLNKNVALAGCWMAPSGEESLEGWWAAGAVTGTRSLDGLPFKYEACAITPIGWMDFPIQSPTIEVYR